MSPRKRGDIHHDRYKGKPGIRLPDGRRTAFPALNPRKPCSRRTERGARFARGVFLQFKRGIENVLKTDVLPVDHIEIGAVPLDFSDSVRPRRLADRDLIRRKIIPFEIRCVFNVDGQPPPNGLSLDDGFDAGAGSDTVLFAGAVGFEKHMDRPHGFHIPDRYRDSPGTTFIGITFACPKTQENSNQPNDQNASKYFQRYLLAETL